VLVELAGRRIETLSGGESQRGRFALTIAGNPDLVFLDEPTVVGMDVETRHLASTVAIGALAVWRYRVDEARS